jgi:hypothetical protein
MSRFDRQQGTSPGPRLSDFGHDAGYRTHRRYGFFSLCWEYLDSSSLSSLSIHPRSSAHLQLYNSGHRGSTFNVRVVDFQAFGLNSRVVHGFETEVRDRAEHNQD